MSNPTDDLVHDFAEACRKKITDFEKTKVRCGIIGRAGSGKSSLINAIAGEQIAKTGPIETTGLDPETGKVDASFVAQEFTHKGLTLVDLPGCGTENWPKETYIDKLNLNTFDCFLLVTSGRFFVEDSFLFRELTSRGKSCFVVRNMFDAAVESGLHDHPRRTEQETRESITQNIRQNLGSYCPKRIYLTSAWHPTRYDLAQLLDDISGVLDGLKRERFIADMATYSEDALKKKREVATERIRLYAGLSAANGLNPIPGLDIAADIGILLQMAAEVSHIYGLTSKQFEYIQRLLGPKAVPGLLTKLAQFAAKYLAKESIILLLKRISSRTATKQASKWVPFVGPLIAAGIGWQATFMLGEQLIDEAESLAREILDNIIKVSDLPEN